MTRAGAQEPMFFPGIEVDYEKKHEMQRNYDNSITILQGQWSQADLDQRFALGDATIWSILFPTGGWMNRRMFNFNLINSHVQMVSGYQRRNRKSSISVPIESGAQKTSDQLTKCLYHVMNNGSGYQILSDAFEKGAVTQGIGFISIYNDYSSDPVSGDIKLRYVDFKSVILDPFFRNKDLSDCRYFWTRQFFDREELALFYNEHYDKIMSLPTRNGNDGKFYFMPESSQIQFSNLVTVDEYWYLTSRECLYIVDTLSGEMQEWVGDEEDTRLLKLKFGDQFKFVKKTKPSIGRTIRVNDCVIIDEVQPYGLDRYPFVPVLGYFNPDTGPDLFELKFKGIPRDLRDTQYLFTRLKVTDLDILESQQQGIKLKKGSLVTPEDGMNRGNGRMLVLKETAQMSDVEPMPIIPPSPTMLQMEDMLKDLFNKISGVNEELLGSASDDKAGILSMLRQGAGLTTLQTLFDHLDYAQTLVGDIVLDMIQKNWTFSKVAKVIGEEPTEEFDNKAFLKYNTKVIQGVLTETQQQLELGQLLNLQQILGPNTPPPVYQRIIDAMYISNKVELKEQITQFQQAQSEQESKMAEIQMQQMQVDNETKMAYAHSQHGLANERMAKIQTDRALAEDRLQRAEQEDTQSLLNLVKSLKELETMDTAHLESKIRMLSKINALDFSEREMKETATF